jgi:HSP20 family protein
MSLIRWSPFVGWDPNEEFEDLTPVRRSRPQSSAQFMPAVDISQTKDAVLVEIPLAGVNPNNVEVSIAQDILHIKGSMKKKTEVEEKNYVHREIRVGSFERSIPLPVHVNGDAASAVSDNGMLKISIPKVEQKKLSPIKIQINNKKK